MKELHITLYIGILVPLHGKNPSWPSQGLVLGTCETSKVMWWLTPMSSIHAQLEGSNDTFSLEEVWATIIDGYETFLPTKRSLKTKQLLATCQVFSQTWQIGLSLPALDFLKLPPLLSKLLTFLWLTPKLVP